MLLACGFSCGQRKTVKDNTDVIKADVVKEVVIPQPPAVIESDEERAQYIAMHYWDNFDFSDTAYVSVPEITEQAFADYLYLLNVLPYEVAEESLHKMLPRTEADTVVHSYFMELFEKYLYEEGSPVRNEELYIPVLKHMIATPVLDEYEKLRPAVQLEMALKNRVGDKAADVVITLANGSKTRLYNVKADYTLLFINNPDCNACSEITAGIKDSYNILMPLINSGKLKVVAVYPDEDLKAWREHQKDMPSNWINGYDAGLVMRNEKTYDTKAIPTLYLLDKDKTVLLKDVFDVRMLEHYFISIE